MTSSMKKLSMEQRQQQRLIECQKRRRFLLRFLLLFLPKNKMSKISKVSKISKRYMAKVSRSTSRACQEQDQQDEITVGTGRTRGRLLQAARVQPEAEGGRAVVGGKAVAVVELQDLGRGEAQCMAVRSVRVYADSRHMQTHADTCRQQTHADSRHMQTADTCTAHAHAHTRRDTHSTDT